MIISKIKILINNNIGNYIYNYNKYIKTKIKFIYIITFIENYLLQNI